MKFSEIRKTVLKTGDPLSTVLTVVSNVTEEYNPGVIPATPRMIALDPFSPERPFPEENRKLRRVELMSLPRKRKPFGFETHWRRRDN